MQPSVLKFPGVVTAVNYYGTQRDLRYFVCDNYFARLNYVRFIRPDYFAEKMYRATGFDQNTACRRNSRGGSVRKQILH
ncbi:hypothetical protein CWM47_20005 [Spirosoma pollinicola]|uniref:Uncharacterized protein n=1 Tax=Spirosoma pollinicola TaxID=2057025 RepID=A0A2K8Z221_9BACT|nr:hypothetical protein CWM47_20005 [Spirosoma pollinicola]